MIVWLLTTFSAGLLAIFLYQWTTHPFFWVDLRNYLKLRSFKKEMQTRMRKGIVTYLDTFLYQARITPDKPFIIYESQSLTYQDVDKRSNQFAKVFRSAGSLKMGDVVALLMCNHPDFICVWFGLCKLGCEVAFLNFNIKASSLLSCLQSCGAKSLVVGADLVASLDKVLPTLKASDISLWTVDHSAPCDGFNSLLDKLDKVSEEPLPDPPKVNIMSNFLFIFTSGTTGHSKAARLGHLKAIMSMAFLRFCGVTSDDIVYITLPLYHMSASLLGVGGCIQLGATCVLKKKFSASQFWKDCVKYDVTVFQYIGELCRYLVNHAWVTEEGAHRVRLAAGSGLRPDVWREFARRFGNIKIREGYGLTEASVGFLNYTDEIGPIGRASYFNKLSMPFELLKYDPKTYGPIRDGSGRCIKAPKGEAGMLVAPLTVTSQFLGYAGNKTQTESKVLRDVVRPGDVYFNTGDLLLCDHRDFLYFCDRIGDTFRWKGENVATTEVSEVLGSLDFLQEVNVYGVTVPGYEGRVGMAAIILKPDHKLDGAEIYKQLVGRLPSYAWPWFLRIQTCPEMTETFKQQKGKLVHEGFNPAVVKEPLYFMSLSQKDYISLSQSLYDDIISGKILL
ncbi:long-chain fatty acid transport protein 6 isoform X1 [Gadus morhua]|uniref:long-chain-fatty-acid--CoA ligase n=1 Tax=Gadus morhua TaxID=8049 RepID=A0A8C5ANN2_GADMO|nr:long-chain fatty acid transport protein 6-like isoform X1 [Gadus morhua]